MGCACGRAADVTNAGPTTTGGIMGRLGGARAVSDVPLLHGRWKGPEIVYVFGANGLTIETETEREDAKYTVMPTVGRNLPDSFPQPTLVILDITPADATKSPQQFLCMFDPVNDRLQLQPAKPGLAQSAQAKEWKDDGALLYTREKDDKKRKDSTSSAGAKDPSKATTAPAVPTLNDEIEVLAVPPPRVQEEKEAKKHDDEKQGSPKHANSPKHEKADGPKKDADAPPVVPAAQPEATPTELGRQDSTWADQALTTEVPSTAQVQPKKKGKKDKASDSGSDTDSSSGSSSSSSSASKSSKGSDKKKKKKEKKGGESPTEKPKAKADSPPPQHEPVAPRAATPLPAEPEMVRDGAESPSTNQVERKEDHNEPAAVKEAASPTAHPERREAGSRKSSVGSQGSDKKEKKKKDKDKEKKEKKDKKKKDKEKEKDGSEKEEKKEQLSPAKPPPREPSPLPPVGAEGVDTDDEKDKKIAHAEYEQHKRQAEKDGENQRREEPGDEKEELPREETAMTTATEQTEGEGEEKKKKKKDKEGDEKKKKKKKPKTPRGDAEAEGEEGDDKKEKKKKKKKDKGEDGEEKEKKKKKKKEGDEGKDEKKKKKKKDKDEEDRPPLPEATPEERQRFLNALRESYTKGDKSGIMNTEVFEEHGFPTDDMEAYWERYKRERAVHEIIIKADRKPLTPRSSAQRKNYVDVEKEFLRLAASGKPVDRQKVFSCYDIDDEAHFEKLMDLYGNDIEVVLAKDAAR